MELIARAPTGRSRDDGVRRRGGFSLLEVMLALSILGFGMLAASVGQISALKTSRQSRTATLAMYLAEQQMETFHSMSGADVKAALTEPGYPNDPAGPIDPDPGDDDPTTYTRRWFIQPDTPETDVISIRVEVDWVDPLGFTRTTSLRSLKADI